MFGIELPVFWQVVKLSDSAAAFFYFAMSRGWLGAQEADFMLGVERPSLSLALLFLALLTSSVLKVYTQQDCSVTVNHLGNSALLAVDSMQYPMQRLLIALRSKR